jgi:hypothetical protein
VDRRHPEPGRWWNASWARSGDAIARFGPAER